MKYYEIFEIINSEGSVSKKSLELFITLLKPQQKEIFNCIPRSIDDAVSAKQIKEMTGIPTKNISSQIKQINVNFPIGIIEEKKGIRKYFKQAWPIAK